MSHIDVIHVKMYHDNTLKTLTRIVYFFQKKKEVIK